MIAWTLPYNYMYKVLVNLKNNLYLLYQKDTIQSLSAAANHTTCSKRNRLLFENSSIRYFQLY